MQRRIANLEDLAALSVLLEGASVEAMEGVTNAGVAPAPQAAGADVPLLWCAPQENRYTLRVTSPEGVQVQLTLARLAGEFADTGALIEAP